MGKDKNGDGGVKKTDEEIDRLNREEPDPNERLRKLIEEDDD